MSFMQKFTYNASTAWVIFGSGTVKQLSAEISRQKLTAPLLLMTPVIANQAETLKTNLDGKIAGIFSAATMHTPTNVTDKAVQYAKTVKADAVVSIEGGSTVGLGKAISINTGLPHICIPTTYTAYNAPMIPDAIERLAGVLPEIQGDAVHGVNVLLTKLEVKQGLKDFGFKEEDIEQAADITVSNPYYNPRPVERSAVRELIRRAWAGEEAKVDL